LSYIPHTEADRRAMLARVGVASLDELFSEIPAAVRLQRPLALPPGLPEMAVDAELRRLAAADAATDAVCFAGGGMYDRYIPAAERALLQRGEFLTAYTPYQAEVSQGTLQFTFEFQTAMCELTGMEVANASMYDGSTAVAEATLMARAATGRSAAVVARSLHPEYREVLATYAAGVGFPLREAPCPDGRTAWGDLVGADTAAVVVPYTNFFGIVEDVAAAAELAHAAGALLVVVCEPSTLGVLEAPSRLGADIVVGDGQPLGLPLAFGGPSFGFFAARMDLVRRMPGRIVGMAYDHEGRRGFVLTLQAREQHIRRAKATSNICTNQAYCALAATIYLTLLGPEGLREVGYLSYQKAHYAARALTAVPGVRLAFPAAPFFDEFALRVPQAVVEPLLARGYLVGPALGRWYPELADCVLVAVTERRTREEIDGLVAAVRGVLA
jgi:glycine dehydrogenase subunit 1